MEMPKKDAIEGHMARANKLNLVKRKYECKSQRGHQQREDANTNTDKRMQTVIIVSHWCMWDTPVHTQPRRCRSQLSETLKLVLMSFVLLYDVHFQTHDRPGAVSPFSHRPRHGHTFFLASYHFNL